MMWAHLWTETADPPQDYLELFLCRDVYHCPPDVLERQNAMKVFRHLQIMEVEEEVRELRPKGKKKKKKK